MADIRSLSRLPIPVPNFIPASSCDGPVATGRMIGLHIRKRAEPGAPAPINASLAAVMPLPRDEAPRAVAVRLRGRWP